MTQPLTTSRRIVPIGLVLCSAALFLAGLGFLTIGLLFLVAPDWLRDGGFRQDAALGIRVAGLLVFGGVAVLLARTAWWLILLRSSAYEITRGLAVTAALTFVIRIGRGEGFVLDWPTLVAAVAMAGYLTRPTVRALFRPPSESTNK